MVGLSSVAASAETQPRTYKADVTARKRRRVLWVARVARTVDPVTYLTAYRQEHGPRRDVLYYLKPGEAGEAEVAPRSRVWAQLHELQPRDLKGSVLLCDRYMHWGLSASSICPDPPTGAWTGRGHKGVLASEALEAWLSETYRNWGEERGKRRARFTHTLASHTLLLRAALAVSRHVLGVKASFSPAPVAFNSGPLLSETGPPSVLPRPCPCGELCCFGPPGPPDEGQAWMPSVNAR